MRTKTKLLTASALALTVAALVAASPLFARGSRDTGGGGDPIRGDDGSGGDYGATPPSPTNQNPNGNTSNTRAPEANIGNDDAGQNGEEQNRIARDVMGSAARDHFRDFRDQRNRDATAPGREPSRDGGDRR